MKHKRFISLVASFFLITSLFASHKDSITFHVKLTHPWKHYLLISNPSDSLAHFTFSLNGKFFSSYPEVISSIKKMSHRNNDSLFYYAWEFQCGNSFPGVSFSKAAWNSNPLLFFNSIGYGLCGKQSQVLLKLWSDLGYKVRSWDLNGHIVPEVYYNKSWHMLDPFHAVYYLNPDSSIASVKELMDQTALLAKPVSLFPDDSLRLRKIIKKYPLLYGSKDDNAVVDLQKDTSDISNFFIDLPPHSTIEFPGLYSQNFSDTLPSASPCIAQCVVKIPQGWTGKISNALVLAEIRGNGIIGVNHKEYHTNDSSLVKLISSHDTLITEITLVSQIDTLELVYMINPLFSRLKANNEIILSGEYTRALQCTTDSFPGTNDIYDRLAKQYFYYGRPRMNLLKTSPYSYKKVAIGNDAVKTTDELIQSFKAYSFSKKYTNAQTEQQAEKLLAAVSLIKNEKCMIGLFEILKYIPQEIVYDDIINASPEQLHSIVRNLSR